MKKVLLGSIVTFSVPMKVELMRFYKKVKFNLKEENERHKRTIQLHFSSKTALTVFGIREEKNKEKRGIIFLSL